MTEESSERIYSQFLVRFQSKTHVITLPNATSNGCSVPLDEIVYILANRTCWPLLHLRVSHVDFPFVQVQVRSSIRGGKGGFGTVLKGESRQAGAKMTTDFGACRDLQGRRLRHVNDEIKLRKWRERKRREAMGEKVDNDDMWKTPSGLYNWHLMTPNWADISKRDTNRIKRQFRAMDRKLEEEMASKKELDEIYQKTMDHYLEETSTMSNQVQLNLKDAIKQGLKSNKRKRMSGNKAESSNDTTDASVNFSGYTSEFDERPNSLVSLTGDVVLETKSIENDDGPITLQSKSDFMTAVFFMDRKEQNAKTHSSYYYEVTLVSGGLAQIGWAYLVDCEGRCAFKPSNDMGDGVGDDENSFAIDLSRGLKFHGGKEAKVPFEWKEGDCLGCQFDGNTGNISYTLNGNDLGVIFADTKLKPLIPAFSCNKNEILELHLTRNSCSFFPAEKSGKVFCAVKKNKTSVEIDLSLSESGMSGNILKRSDGKKTDNSASQQELKLKLNVAPVQLSTQEQCKPRYLNLTEYNSVEELEKLGLDRLKSALMALKVKCGGNLRQRAERLFLLKGIEFKDFPKKVLVKNLVKEG